MRLHLGTKEEVLRVVQMSQLQKSQTVTRFKAYLSPVVE